MAKLKQFCNKFHVLNSRENYPCISLDDYSPSQAVGHSSGGIWGKSKIYRALEEGPQKPGMIG